MRLSLIRPAFIGIVALPVNALGQISAHPIVGPVRDAGVYHVSTGTWSRAGGGTASLGTDVIYNSTWPSGYFGTGWEGALGVDEGILPSTSNPKGGPQDRYTIDGFEFAYCSNADTIDWEFVFYDSYRICDNPDSPAWCINEVAQFSFSGLPTANACWVVTIDLSGGSEFCMEADGGPCAPGYQGPGTLDRFGWGARWTTGNGGTSGPVLAGGEPNWAPEGEGTCYDPGLTCSAGPSALGGTDNFGQGDPNPGCSWFGGYLNTNGCAGPVGVPFAQFHLILYTDCSRAGCDPCPVLRFCSPSVTKAVIEITSCSLADQPLVIGSRIPSQQFGYLLIGAGSSAISDPPGAIGDLCLGGAVIGRYVLDVGSTGAGDQISTDLVGGVTGGGNGDLPNPPGGQLAPGQSWNFQYWFRRPGGQPSSFTDAISVTFL